MSQKFQAAKGTFDILGEDAAGRAALEHTARRILERSGYERIETPAFEATELFARSVGEATDIVQKEMYTFADAGGRSLTLRPEGTAPVCRAYLEHGMHKRPQPVKLWYLSSFFRYEAPQAGRFRQFWQIGAEAIGSDDPMVDAESIVLLAEILEAVGVKGVRLRLASLGTPETRVAYRAELQKYLREHENSLSAEVRSRIDLNPLRAFDSDHQPTQQVMAAAPRLLDWLNDDERGHFEDVQRFLDSADVSYEIDSTLVRGLDYYTHTLFEFTSDALGAQSGVGGGGRYDGLIGDLGGPATPGMGWAAGIERILLSASQPSSARPPLDLFVAYVGDAHRAAAFQLSAAVRRAGRSARVELARRSLKAQLKQADRGDARYVAILGDDGTSLKDMETGEQQHVDPSTIMHHIAKGNV